MLISYLGINTEDPGGITLVEYDYENTTRQLLILKN